MIKVGDEIIKVGSKITYDSYRCIVTEISNVRISFKEIRSNLSWGNIPLYERRPGNKLRNIDMISVTHKPKQSIIRRFMCFISLHKWIGMCKFTESCPYCYKTKTIKTWTLK